VGQDEAGDTRAPPVASRRCTGSSRTLFVPSFVERGSQPSDEVDSRVWGIDLGGPGRNVS
jgi:hypothetical protein